MQRIGVRGRYRLEDQFARGSTSVIWRGFDMVLERKVAVKEFPPCGDPGVRDRIRQQALALARLSHPHVVQLYDFVEEEDERLFIAMELMEGGDLEALLGAQHPPLLRTLEIARQVATGLAFAHARGIVHRSVKPANVLLTKEGQAKVSDFGLASLADSEATAEGLAALGDPRYASPEQALGKQTDAQSDVYSFAALLFHLATGRPLFEGDATTMLEQHITQPAPAISGFVPRTPKALDVLVGRMLAKDPAERPRDLEAIANQFAALR